MLLLYSSTMSHGRSDSLTARLRDVNCWIEGICRHVHMLDCIFKYYNCLVFCTGSERLGFIGKPAGSPH